MVWLFSLLISITLAAENTVPAVEQAQALAVKKNRQEAALVLSNALAAPGAKNRAKLSEALNQISRVFFTDKGQRLFEAGQSVMFETPDVALGQFHEALALEDENILILDSTARVQLFKQDCTGALATLKRARELNAQLAEPAVLELRALVCLKNFDSFREKLKEMPALDKATEPYVQYLVAQDFLQQKMLRRAQEVLTKVSEDQPRFPEVYYWLSRVMIEQEGDSDTYALKYVSLCKGVSARERKLYALEPRLCLNAKEVSDELVKKNGDL